MSHIEFLCKGCGAQAGIFGELSDDPEERYRELDEQYEFERLWDEQHASCDSRRPVRVGIVRALVGPDSTRDFSGLSWRERADLRRAGVKMAPIIAAHANDFTDHGRAGCCAIERDPSITSDTAQVPAAGDAAGATSFTG